MSEGSQKITPEEVYTALESFKKTEYYDFERKVNAFISRQGDQNKLCNDNDSRHDDAIREIEVAVERIETCLRTIAATIDQSMGIYRRG